MTHPIVVTCAFCGQQFPVSSAYEQKRRRFCNRKCFFGHWSSESVESRLRRWSKRNEATGCLEWQGGHTAFGYGSINIKGRSRNTHRVAYELAYGPIPKGLSVCHMCDNPPCINPEHLVLATQGANIRDMHHKKRANPPRGERCARATLTWAKVREIRRQYSAGGVTQANLAATYGVKEQTICKIVNSRLWKE